MLMRTGYGSAMPFLVLVTMLILPTRAACGPLNNIVASLDHATIAVQAGTKGGSIGTGLDVNVSTLFLNAGLNAWSWKSREGAANEDGARSEIGLYAGMGLATVLQLQAGYAIGKGFKLRLRSDVPLTLTEGAWREFKKGSYWVITPFIEISLSAHQGTLFGLGLGRAF